MAITGTAIEKATSITNAKSKVNKNLKIPNEKFEILQKMLNNKAV